MQGIGKKRKKYWITVWLVLAALALGALVTYAVYTEVFSVKRVVSTKSSPKDLFSSNCLMPDLYERRVPTREYTINVCNYDQKYPDIPNPLEVQYTLFAELRVKYGNEILTFAQLQTKLADNTAAYEEIVARAGGYSIGKVQDNNPSGKIQSPVMTALSVSNGFSASFGTPAYETLPPGVVSADRYRLILPPEAFEREDPEFYVFVQAVPVNSALSELETLLYGAKNIVITASWTGALAEAGTGTTDYDFYNYIIAGSGSGKLDLLWDPEWFQVSDYFFNPDLSGVTFDGGNNTPVEVSGGEFDGWLKVTLVVDSSEKSRYTLQLFKAKENTSYTGENNAALHIACRMQ